MQPRRRPIASACAPPRRGFTLIELIVAAGLLGFLAVTATFFWIDNLTLMRTVNADSAAIADGRALLDRLAREIREVKYSSASSQFCIATMTATQFVFNKTSGTYATTCGGATPTGANSDIAVSVQQPSGGTTLNLGYAGTLAAPAATKALSSDATAFSLGYRDAAYSSVGVTAANVRYVELNLTLTATGGQANTTRTVVALRNN